MIETLLYALSSKFLFIGLPWLSTPVILALLERYNPPLQPLDRRLLKIAHQFKRVRRDRFFEFITWGGSLFVLVPLTILVSAFMAKIGRSDAGPLLALNLAGASLYAHLFKLWFRRPRPNYFPVIGELPIDYSYPSAHTAQIVAFVMALGWILGADELSLIAMLLIGSSGVLMMLVAASRIYLQVHYPSDVLGGVITAVLWSIGLFNLLQTVGIVVR